MSKSKLIKIMKFIDDVSNLSNYDYYCGYGTLLGTVREKGIIPWDNDCDIWVPIPDYNKFIDELIRNNPGIYDVKVQNVQGYNQLFSRVSMKGENHLETSVDIFPLVGISSNYLAQKKFIRKSQFIFKFYYAKKVSLGEYRKRKLRGLQILLAKILVLAIPDKWFIKEYNAMSLKYPYKKSEYLYNICGSYGQREILKKEWFSEIIKTEFENFTVKSPSGYDELLKHIYGDYMVSKKEKYLS